MTLLSIFLPHRRAAELIDQKLDAERGEGELSSADRAWLDAHVSRCSECSAQLEARAKQLRALRSLGTAKAPAGFAGRVLLAAKTRSAPVIEEQESWLRPMLPYSQLAIGAAMLVVVLAGAAVLFRVNDSAKTLERNAAVAGAQGLAQKIEAPHFVVRAPSMGAAKARSEITKVVEAHGGSFMELENGNAIVAHIPRADLVGVTQDLAARAAFRMTKADAGTELPADLHTIIIRFELE